MDRPAEVSDASRRRRSARDGSLDRYPASVALLISREAPLWSIPTSWATALTVAAIPRPVRESTADRRPARPVPDEGEQELARPPGASHSVAAISRQMWASSRADGRSGSRSAAVTFP